MMAPFLPYQLISHGMQIQVIKEHELKILSKYNRECQISPTPTFNCRTWSNGGEAYSMDTSELPCTYNISYNVTALFATFYIKP